jgi:DNA polymerase-1
VAKTNELEDAAKLSIRRESSHSNISSKPSVIVQRKLLILDGNAIFHRSRNALKRGAGELTTSWGQPVTGTYGVLNTLFSTLEKEDYDSILPVFDAGGNFRKKEDEAYKANRIPTDDSFKSDITLLREELLFYLGFNPVAIPGYEADDIIASVAKSAVAFSHVDILTCDRDLLGCVSNRVNVILFNSAKKVRRCGIDDVLDIYGVYPAEVRYLKALSGDASDNVAGIPRIGDKTAAKIVIECRPTEANPEFTGADKICMHPKVKDHASTFISNLRVISMVDDIEVKWLANTPPTSGVLRSVFEQSEFGSFLKEARFKRICEALKVTL